MNAKEKIHARKKNKKLASRKEHANLEAAPRYASSETYPSYFDMTQVSGQAYLNSVNSVHQNSEGKH